MMHSIGEDGRLLAVNERWLEVLGYTEEEVLGRKSLEFMTAESREDAAKYLPKFWKEGSARDVAYQFVKKNGEVIDILLSGVVERDAEGNITHQFAVLNDVTEQKEADDRVRQSEEKFRLLAENISEVFWLLDPKDYRVLYVSPSYEALWGRTCESLYEDPKSWLESVHPEDLQRVSAAVDEHAVTGVFDQDFRIKRQDGSLRWVWDRGFAVKDEAGEVRYGVGIVADITDRKRAEDELQRAREELESRIESRVENGGTYGLTFRELTVLQLLAGGKGDKEIAAVLGIRTLTVSKHVSNILHKMNVHSRTAAGTRAVREGLLD